MKPFEILRMRSPAASLPIGAFGNHAYWRVFCADNWGDATGIVIQEVEFLDAAGTVIPATGGTAIGSDTAVGNLFSYAFDGTGLAWFADAAPTNQWIGYQFPSAMPIEQVRITTNTSGTNYLNRMPKNCALQYSDDGISWTTAFSFFAINLTGGQLIFPDTAPPSGYHHWWRVFCSDNNGGTNYISIVELQLRATSGGADQTPVQSADAGTATERPIFSSEVGGGNEGYVAFDNTTNSWLNAGTTNGWIGMLFKTAVKVEEIAVTCGSTTLQRNRAPKNMKVEYSDDGVTWTTQKTLAAQTAWGVDETRVLAAI